MRFAGADRLPRKAKDSRAWSNLVTVIWRLLDQLVEPERDAKRLPGVCTLLVVSASDDKGPPVNANLQEKHLRTDYFSLQNIHQALDFIEFDELIFRAIGTVCRTWDTPENLRFSLNLDWSG